MRKIVAWLTGRGIVINGRELLFVSHLSFLLQRENYRSLSASTFHCSHAQCCRLGRSSVKLRDHETTHWHISYPSIDLQHFDVITGGLIGVTERHLAWVCNPTGTFNLSFRCKISLMDVFTKSTSFDSMHSTLITIWSFNHLGVGSSLSESVSIILWRFLVVCRCKFFTGTAKTLCLGDFQNFRPI